MSSTNNRKKLLLMGRSGSGKSSMRSIIFSNYSAFDTRRLGATIDVEHSHLRFLGNMTLNLWDCGGQDVFMENYFSKQKDHIFQMVQVLIHVFDVESQEVIKDIEIFMRSLKQLKKYSPDAKIFVLLHKMDLVQLDKRDELFQIMMNKLSEASTEYGFPDLVGFPTSIWDESLYRAWSQIVCSLIPNMSTYETNLIKFKEMLNAYEIILFEKMTFLVICSSNGNLQIGNNENDSNNNNKNGKKKSNIVAIDPKRFEKISNIMKNFKQSCTKLKSDFKTFVLNDSIYVSEISPNMVCFIVLNDTRQSQQLVLENVSKASQYFQ
ncbi:similar to Saccharomyces cerevisiae YML121W GTR1 Cytoplasmic GTP binding protein and negative regulator of the Ran/Tc4 GTPase cycle [Maudiozyma barnettii]|uniref:GTP-binding protein n=1 Tax=Maudiozyma barnettii TaxID=61262 RepID=A0A8H2VD28_9SACH|nr:Rag GTPase GTR1 [Kazachstania barnettii]CAB4252972.1 similar to Saccharomyces cerevisiae YML121W GTR1 Cytoplasmic GTP binding protein and negative regulator of the Ran/Tc4 GTPase cycle [Kazachstania barnettii]CAD1780767.1 similar to Saccharomyces cerevisiae YML121W GTR1 Cytoplasmic GTP binding protein and negative regulator of the Ran/Tc4 GTPase cycle [Kazachstania barnettii]